MSLLEVKMSGDKYRGLKQYEFEMLSTYNGEKDRGIVHMSGWRDRMSFLQARWDQYGKLEGEGTRDCS